MKVKYVVLTTRNADSVSTFTGPFPTKNKAILEMIFQQETMSSHAYSSHAYTWAIVPDTEE